MWPGPKAYKLSFPRNGFGFGFWWGWARNSCCNLPTATTSLTAYSEYSEYGIWHIACLARISAANLNPGAQVFSELCASGWPIKVSYGIAIEQLGHRCV